MLLKSEAVIIEQSSERDKLNLPSLIISHHWPKFDQKTFQLITFNFYNQKLLEQKQKGKKSVFVLKNFPEISLICISNVKELLSQKNKRISSLSAAAAAAKSHQLYPTLCDPIDGSPPGSSVPGILQARILERVAISFSSSLSKKYLKCFPKVEAFHLSYILVTLAAMIKSINNQTSLSILLLYMY